MTNEEIAEFIKEHRRYNTMPGVPFESKLEQALTELVTLREQLRWRKQSVEPAPESESPTLVRNEKGRKWVAYPGCGAPDWTEWLPVIELSERLPVPK